MQHCFGFAVAAVGTANMDEGIDEEGMTDEETIVVETIEEIGYGKTDFLNGSYST